MNRSTTANSTCPKDKVSCSKDSLLATESLYLRLKFCAEIPRLGKPLKRCQEC